MKVWHLWIFWFLGYCAVAGIAWWFVLDISYPLWKLFIVSGFQVVVNTIGMCLSGKKIKGGRKVSDGTCPDCGHSLKDNEHGPDQNDYDYEPETGKTVHMGSCTYCKECQKEES